MLLRHQQIAKKFTLEEERVKGIMDMADKVIQAERIMNLLLRGHTYSVRQFSSNTTGRYKDSLLEVPPDI